jgi:peptide/nickel transport system permease protein
MEIVGEALPATLQLTTAALALNFLLGCAVGVISGIFFRRWWGRALDGLSLVLYALPVFWLALLAIWLFSVTLQWLPASGMNSLFINEKSGWSFWLDRLRHLLLPATVLGVTGAAATARYVRGSVQTVLRQEYVRLAFAKGLPRFKIYVGHVLRNGLLPVITLMGIYFPFLLSGAFVTEVIFAWPGLGRILYEAVSSRDIPVLMAVNFMGAVFVMVGNLLADLLYRFADPRIQLP